MFIKICGITNIEDALLATELGASALGFVFALSKRKIAPKQAAKIISELSEKVEKVGVFVNETKQNMLKIGESTGLTCIQLHGNKRPKLCQEIGKYFKVIKTIKIAQNGRLISQHDFYVWKSLLDIYDAETEGGSGKKFDWKIINQFNLEQIIIAGGLNSDNIKLLLSKFKPFGIDVSSGVESCAGKKSSDKLQKFFNQIPIQIE